MAMCSRWLKREGLDRNYGAYRSRSEDRFDEENARYDALHGRRVETPVLARPVLREVFVLPFGKHKGKTLDRVPKGYLIWLSCQHWLDDRTREALDRL